MHGAEQDCVSVAPPIPEMASHPLNLLPHLVAALLLAGLCLPNAYASDEEARADDPDFVGSDRPTIPADDIPEGAVIGELIFERQNVFDLTNPKEDNWFYALANRLHWVTRESLIRRQLLITEGDEFSQRLVNESGRILRRNSFLFDAIVRPVAVEGDKVDVEVATRDTWTLVPDLSAARTGGENRTKFGIEETNLLGRGQLVRLARIDNVDRSSNSLEFADNNITDKRWSLYARAAENSDGYSNQLNFVRPFFALDTRWTAGTILLDDKRAIQLYRLGNTAAEFERERQYATVFGGWSKGLVGRWTRRLSTGVVYDDNRFSEVPNSSLEPAIPEDRKLVYPFVTFEMLEDQFETGNNRNQIGKTEDFYLGTRLSASLGWADETFGADRSAAIYSATFSQGFGRLDGAALLVDLKASGRYEGGETANALASLDARYYWHWADKRTFFVTLSGTAGHNLDLDNPVQLGGDSGLRGYPLRYQSGDSKLLFTVEQRFFTDWYPFRLFRIGGAVFADVGRTWGRNPIGEPELGWLRDVGLGLRFAPTRASSNKMIHLDIAFPLDGDPSIDSMQILLESKRSF
jgi:outer membrane protein assembly factor BamA